MGKKLRQLIQIDHELVHISGKHFFLFRHVYSGGSKNPKANERQNLERDKIQKAKVPNR